MLRTQRARPAPSTDDRLSTLPDELKVLIVKQAGRLPSHHSKMDEFLAKEQFRLRAMQALRALDSTFSRMPLTRSLLYDATSSVWAIQAAIRTTEDWESTRRRRRRRRPSRRTRCRRRPAM